MNTVLDSDGGAVGVGYEWLLCECPWCGHEDIRLCRFIPAVPENAEHIYFAICACCKHTTEDCRTVYEAVKKWDEQFEIT